MFKNKMETESIPERVYTLCKIVEKAPITNQDLKERMEPGFLEQKTVYFNFYRNTAEELGLISISDNVLSISVQKEVLECYESFRKYVNGILYKYETGEFYAVTKAYFGLDNKIFSGEKNVAAMTTELSKMCQRNIDAKSMRAWRFWASFLGFGYLQEMFLIPNADVFVADIIEQVDFDKGVKYSFGEFVKRISPYINVIWQADEGSKQINYGLSCGLRTLHDQGIITMEHILDQEDIWSIYPLKAHAIATTVTNITIN